jgi:phage tail-like protein
VSCGPSTATFRLLDAYAGWDPVAPDGAKRLRGLDDPRGIELAFTGGAALQLSHLRPYLLPPRLGRGCNCTWYLAAVTDPPALLQRLPCLDGDACWTRVPDMTPCRRDAIEQRVELAQDPHPAWLAAGMGRVVVADAQTGLVTGYVESAWRTTLSLQLENVGPMALLSNGELLIAVAGAPEILRFTPSGDPIARWTAPGPVVRIVPVRCVTWIVTHESSGYHLYRSRRPGARFTEQTVERFASETGPSGVVWSDEGFCIEERGADGFAFTRCYDWTGCPLDRDRIVAPAGASRERTGQLLTIPIDSGIPRARWHRVRIDADVPFGTSLSTAVATTDEADPAVQGVAEPAWSEFPSGVPHPQDWQRPQRSLDYLVDQPPGRFLFLRLRLTGDGQRTPTVRRIRLDVPRSTSADFLPDVYRENPQAEDFLERFVSIFDAAIGELDDAIQAYPALLDADSVPDAVLPWIGSFLDLAFESGWDARRRKALIRAAPRLYRRRGTVAGLREALRIVTDVDVAIDELPLTRAWRALGTGVIRGMRLFGRSRARLRLGSSAVGGAPLMSYGDPDRDPFTMLAHRFAVQVPRTAGADARALIARLVESLKPAHTIAGLRVAGDGFVVGSSSSVGVETAFLALPAPRLGRNGNIRLRRQSVVWRGAHRGGGMRVGFNTVVGENTRAE